MTFTKAGLSAFLLAAAALLPAHAEASCSKVIKVPISPIGLSVFVGPDGFINGVYPDLLRRLSSQDGCVFEMSEVPRARLESMFEAGRIDVLIPASRSARRDKTGIFIPLIYSRATVISYDPKARPVESADDLLNRRELRVALVRGFDFGQPYQELVAKLTEQGRVVFDKDAAGIARVLQSGMADLTIMAPSILVGAMLADQRTEGLVEHLRYEPIEELPWNDSGVYLSRTALQGRDLQAVKEIFERAAKTGAVWKDFQRHYPPASLTGSIKPR